MGVDRPDRTFETCSAEFESVHDSSHVAGLEATFIRGPKSVQIRHLSAF